MTDFWNGRFKVFMINMGHIIAVDKRFLHSMFQVLWLVRDMKASVPIKHWFQTYQQIVQRQLLIIHDAIFWTGPSCRRGGVASVDPSAADTAGNNPTTVDCWMDAAVSRAKVEIKSRDDTIMELDNKILRLQSKLPSVQIMTKYAPPPGWGACLSRKGEPLIGNQF